MHVYIVNVFLPLSLSPPPYMHVHICVQGMGVIFKASARARALSLCVCSRHGYICRLPHSDVLSDDKGQGGAPQQGKQKQPRAKQPDLVQFHHRVHELLP